MLGAEIAWEAVRSVLLERCRKYLTESALGFEAYLDFVNALNDVSAQCQELKGVATSSSRG